MSNNLPVVPGIGKPITAAEVVQIENLVTNGVMLIDDIESLQEWRAQAAALEAYLRSRELQRPMLGAQRRVEARIGQLLGDGPGRGCKEMNSHADSFSTDDRQNFRILANGFDCLEPEEWRKSRRALVSLVRQKCGLMPEAPELPHGKFRCIVADPPWKLDTGPDVFGGTGERGHDALAYEQMSLDDIKQLPVEDRSADDAHLYLWTTNRYLESSYDVARAWGFKPSVMLVWAKKPHGVGLGDAYRLTTEFVLYARKGKLKERGIVETTWFNWNRGRHSKKPDEFYSMVETLSIGPFLEMFAREPRYGWTVWGNEV